MSNAVKRLPEIENLKQELNEFPENIVHYSKYNNFVGSSKSIKYIIKKINEYYESKKD